MQTAANDDKAPPRLGAVGPEDLQAYVEGSLGRERRTAVEGFLACNPDLAARVMTELHMRGRRLARAAAPSRQGARRALAAAAALAFLATGALAWRVADADAPPGWRELDGDRAPSYVEEAAMSHRTTILRVAMASQAETPDVDPDEIRREVKVRLPSVPQDWRVLDVQVYPSDDGPGVNLLVEEPEGRRLNLFAVQADTGATETPVVATRGEETAVYWEQGEVAFVLTGEGTRQELLAGAEALSRRNRS